MNVEWIVALMTIVLIITAAAIVIILVLRNNDQQGQAYVPAIRWNVELWNIQYGYRVNLVFTNSRTVGRYDLCGEGSVHPGASADHTISREHVLLYDQYGSIWIWNLSAVNPAMINGERINAPRQIAPGNRLEMGNSAYLITRVEICNV